MKSLVKKTQKKTEMGEKKDNQIAVRIYFPQEDPMLPAESVWIEAEHWAI